MLSVQFSGRVSEVERIEGWGRCGPGVTRVKERSTSKAGSFSGGKGGSSSSSLKHDIGEGKDCRVFSLKFPHSAVDDSNAYEP